MAITAQQKQRVEQIKVLIDKLLAIPQSELIKEAELGNQLSFKEVEPTIQSIFQITKQVNEVDLLEIPSIYLNPFSSQIEQTIQFLYRIKEFNLNTPNLIQERNQLMVTLENCFEEYYSSAIPILIAAQFNSNTILNEQTRLKKIVEEIEEEQKSSKEVSQKYLADIQEVLENARKAAVEVGITQHNKIFKEEADEHSKLSTRWLYWMIGLLFLTTAVGILILFIKPSAEDSHYLIHFTITKIVVLSVLFYALSLCTKNYKAHKHNAILNKHRQNALNTFETFSAAAGSDLQTKNAVLLEVTRTIFSNQQTGYAQPDNDGDSPNRIIEIVKNTTQRAE